MKYFSVSCFSKFPFYSVRLVSQLLHNVCNYCMWQLHYRKYFVSSTGSFFCYVKFNFIHRNVTSYEAITLFLSLVRIRPWNHIMVHDKVFHPFFLLKLLNWQQLNNSGSHAFSYCDFYITVCDKSQIWNFPLLWYQTLGTLWKKEPNFSPSASVVTVPLL